MMPFMGVRISWLILARNWLLASLAALACSAKIAAACNEAVNLAFKLDAEFLALRIASKENSAPNVVNETTAMLTLKMVFCC